MSTTGSIVKVCEGVVVFLVVFFFVVFLTTLVSSIFLVSFTSFGCLVLVLTRPVRGSILVVEVIFVSIFIFEVVPFLVEVAFLVEGFLVLLVAVAFLEAWVVGFLATSFFEVVEVLVFFSIFFGSFTSSIGSTSNGQILPHNVDTSFY